MLVKPKDRLEREELNGLIYHMPCAGRNCTACSGRYVGETERTFSARFNEHTSTATNAQGHYKSAMLQHAREHNHHFRREDATILAYEHDWAKRGIYEALYIKALNPSINIDQGRHTLSSHFDKILSEIVKQPAAPLPHDPETETMINTARRGQGRPRRQPAINQQQQSQPTQSPPQQPQQQQPPQSQRQSQRIRDRRQQSSSQPS